ncbi:MAG: hypothetical protein VYD75_04080 [Pseudomonadota bacterium]|nr:hypothetical protein [Pseudomonadota bacterium]
MVRSDILLLSDEEILASLGAYKKSRSLNDAKNAETKPPAVERNKNRLNRRDYGHLVI